MSVPAHATLVLHPQGTAASFTRPAVRRAELIGIALLVAYAAVEWLLSGPSMGLAFAALMAFVLACVVVFGFAFARVSRIVVADGVLSERNAFGQTQKVSTADVRRLWRGTMSAPLGPVPAVHLVGADDQVLMTISKLYDAERLADVLKVPIDGDHTS